MSLGFFLLSALSPILRSTALADQGGLKTSLAVDLVGSFPVGEETSSVQYQSKESYKLRSAEFMLYAPIDPRFDGVLSFAAHPEGSQAYGEPEVHEAYLSSVKLLDGFRFKAGQFFLGIGRINQIHQHDWPFITPTIMQKELFGSNEGIIDTGLEVSSLLPLPFYMDVTIGVTNGRDFGHSHVEDDLPKSPTHYSRIVTYNDIVAPTQIGFNYVGRTSAIGEKMQLYGFDLTSKIRTYGHLTWLLQAELWKRELTLSGTTDELLGGYAYLQHYLTRDLAVGARYDYSTVTSTENDNSRGGYEINLLYFSSEFARVGLAYYHNQRDQEGRDKEETTQVLMQTAFILGAHPSHDF